MKFSMKLNLMQLAALVCLAASPALAQLQKVVLNDRYYLIDMPDRPSGTIILALHNATGDPEEFRDKSQLSPAAQKKGYAVVYPEGLGKSWNGFYCCGYAQEHQVDDLRFLDRVVADVAARFGLDPTRVYVTGMGNGSVMAETYAARRSTTVKAVAGVAGTLDLRRTPAAAVPLLHIQGLDDKVVPYGIRGAEYGAKHRTDAFTSTPDLISAFVSAHGQLTQTTRAIDTRPDGTSVIQDDFDDARGVTRVRLLTIKGGGHVWPAEFRKGEGNTRDISATTEILRFFDKHP